MSGRLDVLANFFAELQQQSVNIVGRDRIELTTTAFGQEQPLKKSESLCAVNCLHSPSN